MQSQSLLPLAYLSYYNNIIVTYKNTKSHSLALGTKKDWTHSSFSECSMAVFLKWCSQWEDDNKQATHDLDKIVSGISFLLPNQTISYTCFLMNISNSCFVLLGCRDRHGRSGPIVTCSNAAQLSRRYNVPLDHSRGFGKSRHSSDEHTCPLLALGCWMPVLQRLHGQIVVGELCGTVSSPVLLVLIPPKRGLGFQTWYLKLGLAYHLSTDLGLFVKYEYLWEMWIFC